MYIHLYLYIDKKNSKYGKPRFNIKIYMHCMSDSVCVNEYQIVQRVYVNHRSVNFRNFSQKSIVTRR